MNRVSDEQLDELERNLHEVLRFHREQYEKAIKPIVDRLVQIESLRAEVARLNRQAQSFADQAVDWRTKCDVAEREVAALKAKLAERDAEREKLMDEVALLRSFQYAPRDMSDGKNACFFCGGDHGNLPCPDLEAA